MSNEISMGKNETARVVGFLSRETWTAVFGSISDILKGKVVTGLRIPIVNEVYSCLSESLS